MMMVVIKRKKQVMFTKKNEKTGRYDIVGERFNYVYSKEHVSIMPRMFNEDETVDEQLHFYVWSARF